MKTKSSILIFLGVCAVLFMALCYMCPPTVPVLKSPVDIVLAQTEPPKVVLEWYPSTDEHKIRYHVQVATEVNFQNIQFEKEHIPDTLCKVSNLDAGTSYYWRVRAYCDKGGYSDWSDIGHFTTESKLKK